MPALDPHLQGTERVREVFNRVRNGDNRVADLYAEDGVVVTAGHQIEGREAIRAFYQRAIDSIHPKPEVQAVLEAPPHYVVLVDVPNDQGRMRALDVFELGDDGIHRLEIFSRE